MSTIEKLYNPSGKKASRNASEKQLAYARSLAKATGSIIDASTASILKGMEASEMSEAIDLMKSGKAIRISTHITSL